MTATCTGHVSDSAYSFSLPSLATTSLRLTLKAAMLAFAATPLLAHLRPPIHFRPLHTNYCLPAAAAERRRRTRTDACAAPPLIPTTYEQLYARAAAAAAAAVGPAGGLRAIEIEFPPTPSLSRAGTGSRAEEDAARAANARLAAAVARAVDGGAAGGVVVVVVAFDRPMQRAVGSELRGGKVRVCLRGEVDAVEAGAEGLVIVAASPAAEEEWSWLERAVRSGGTSCVVCNGLFSNGLDWLEPVFYVKPCTGWGIVMLEFPGRLFQAVSGRTGSVLQGVRVLRQRRILRPDLQTASAVLMKDFYAED